MSLEAFSNDILYHIFEKVPFKDLVAYTRVNKRWYYLIHGVISGMHISLINVGEKRKIIGTYIILRNVYHGKSLAIFQQADKDIYRKDVEMLEGFIDGVCSGSPADMQIDYAGIHYKLFYRDNYLSLTWKDAGANKVEDIEIPSFSKYNVIRTLKNFRRRLSIA
jgi:hypothetical protein